MTWSYSELVKQHGEERALELLQEQRGFGRSGEPTTPRKSSIPERCPLCGESWGSNKSCGRRG